MGTRSTITFIEKHGKEYTPIVKVYQQYDGYIEGVGHDLCKWLLTKKMINGIGINQHSPDFVNGIGCLAAQYISHFKTNVGDLYICPLDAENQDYNYYVIVDCDKELNPKGTFIDDVVNIYVFNWDDPVFFKGSPSELLKYKEPE